MAETAPAGGRSPDVIVVGGGVTGASIAWRLAQAGPRVLLLERRGICAGASGRNAGHTGVSSGMHTAPRTVRALHDITTANLELLKSLPDELDKDFELRLPGWLRLPLGVCDVLRLLLVVVFYLLGVGGAPSAPPARSRPAPSAAPAHRPETRCRTR